MEHAKPDILEVRPDSLAAWLAEQGAPPYRLSQVLQWVYRKMAGSFAAMSNLPLELRSRLDGTYTFPTLKEVEQRRSQDGSSGKLLFELEDGEQIESVWMDDRGRYTFCISSQAGCALGCSFCATGAMGFGRNLRLGEILGQVVALARAATWPANVVFMGMGEPLLNTEAVIPALEALADPQRFGLGSRRITVSTAGVTPGIRELSKCAARPKLALSLNSPFDDQRSQLMPINGKYPLAEVLQACREYAEATGRRLAFEYVLLGSLNTSPSAARAVAKAARDLGALVNLIAFNPVAGCNFQPPNGDETKQFKTVLEGQGVEVTERFRRGRDIAAACGQLRGKHAQGPPAAAPCQGTAAAAPCERTPAAPCERTPAAPCQGTAAPAPKGTARHRASGHDDGRR